MVVGYDDKAKEVEHRSGSRGGGCGSGCPSLNEQRV